MTSAPTARRRRPANRPSSIPPSEWRSCCSGRQSTFSTGRRRSGAKFTSLIPSDGRVGWPKVVRTIEMSVEHGVMPEHDRAMNSIRFLALLVAFASASAAQQDFSNVEIKATHVAGNVHMLEGRGGNIGVSVGPDGVLLVDNEFLPLAGKIEAAVKKLDPGPLKFMLN